MRPPTDFLTLCSWYRQGQVVPSDSVQSAFQQRFMPTAIFLSRVSAASAFCSAICDAEFEGSAVVAEPSTVQACQAKLQSIIGAFQENRDAAHRNSALDLQRFTAEFDGLCADLNARNDLFRPLVSDCSDQCVAGGAAWSAASCLPKCPVLAAWGQRMMGRVIR
jgi:hypothetical protein